MELWGGIECTLTRVADRYTDQLAHGGHYARAGDLDCIAALGLRTLRYPVLWERAAPAPGEVRDWSFADDRLERLRRLGITVIAGLVHHGCGPAYVSMLDDGFVEGLARYAGEVAARFPWLEHYTPVNEPLTTARFCGLYGHWYPHGRNDRAFARILINECRATVLAMRAIRAVNPAARLVQTDDLGTVYGTRHLAYQAQFENHRRWLAWDLLCGTVDRTHPLHDYLRGCGITDAELAWFREHPCPPQVIGIDHYVTSDRYLDEDLDRYPRCTHGGNGRHAYADVDAVRVLERPGTSLREIIRAAWQRYRIPIVLTEVHIGCTEPEQIRWLHEAWTACHEATANGVDIRAMTAWSLMGAYDWDSLLTANRGHYEPGAFNVRTGVPVATSVARYISAMTAGAGLNEFESVLSTPGWWRQHSRLLYQGRCPPESRVA